MGGILRAHGHKIRVGLQCPSAVQQENGWTLSLHRQNRIMSPPVVYGDILTIRPFLRCWFGRELPWINLDFLVIEINTLRLRMLQE